jgi:hypothetical protein
MYRYPWFAKVFSIGQGLRESVLLGLTYGLSAAAGEAMGPAAQAVTSARRARNCIVDRA